MITRRHALALTLGAAAAPALAGAPLLGPALPRYTRFTLGAFEVTTLLPTMRPVENPHGIFGLNVDDATFDQVSAEAGLPTDVAQFFFTPTLVNTGEKLVLFDTGYTASEITSALASAGYTPDQVDTVVLTHMHSDHIGGLMDGETHTFKNADYVTGALEYDSWDFSGDETFETRMRPLEDETRFIDPDTDVTGGITSVAAFGHTPGHMAYRLESEGQLLLIAGDFANHYLWSLAHPDWLVRFDRDRDEAARTRRALLDMLAAEKMPFIGYHMPFPGLGYVETNGSGFRYVPESYQLRRFG